MPAVKDAVATLAALDAGRFQASVPDADEIQEKVEKSQVKKVQKLVEDFPGRTVEVVRGWMAEGV